MGPQLDQEVPDHDLPDETPQQSADRSPASAPQSVSGQEVPSEDLPQDSGQEVSPDDLPQNLVSDYNSPEQETKTALEGAAQGLIGPLAPLIETKVLGVDPQNITNRQQAHPVLHGGAEAATFAGSMLLGTGEAAVLAKIGEAASKAAEVGKIGSAAIKGLVEGGLFQGGDEISKSILGQGDPNDPVSSALLHTGAGALMGGLGGGVIEGFAGPTLAKIGESKMGTRLSQFLSDMGSRLQFNQTNPDMVGALGDQLENMHSSLGAARDEIYGASGLKAQNIKHLTQDVTKDQLNQHIGDVTQHLIDAPDEIQNDPGFKAAVNKWKNAVTTQIDPITLQPTGNVPSASDIFQSTDELKRQVQKLAKFGYTGSAASVVADQASPLSGKLADTLESTANWNKAGTFQKGLNEAVSDFIPKNQNFVSQFTAKDATDPNRIISPGKVNTYINQLGKPSAEIKQKFLGEWVDAAEKYQEQINSLHESLGLQTPLTAPPTDIIKSTLGQQSAGSKAADLFYQHGITGFSNRIAAGIGGSTLGAEEGYKHGGVLGGIAGIVGGGIGGALLPHLADAIGTKVRESAVPFVIRALSSGAPDQVGAALNYAASASKGASKLSSGISALFKAGGTQAIDAYTSDGDKEKLNKFIESGEMNRQIQAQTLQPAPAPTPVQYFAEGGEVKNMLSEPHAMTPAQPVLKGVGGIDKAMPEHAALLSAAKSRVNNYLNSVRPQKNAAKLTYDDEPKNTEQHRSYQKALDLAVNPIGILNHLKAGTLTPENLNHFKSMWPEVHDHISKKITQKIVDSQIKGEEKPTYRVRQSMSMFLGAPLDSTMTPQAIRSIQAIYAPKQIPQGPPTKAKKGTSKLGEISKDHYTQDQASSQRAQATD